MYNRDYTYEGGYAAARQLLAQASNDLPEALFIANDMMTVGAMKALIDAGLRIPDNIYSHCNAPYAAYMTPALTTLAMPTEQAGRISAQIMMDWLNVGKPVPSKCISLSYSLQVRESCGAHQRQRPYPDTGDQHGTKLSL